MSCSYGRATLSECCIRDRNSPQSQRSLEMSGTARSLIIFLVCWGLWQLTVRMISSATTWTRRTKTSVWNFMSPLCFLILQPTASSWRGSRESVIRCSRYSSRPILINLRELLRLHRVPGGRGHLQSGDHHFPVPPCLRRGPASSGDRWVERKPSLSQ